MANNLKLANRVAVVTGGGTGIGRAISVALAGAGAKVIVNYSQSREQAADTVAEIESAGGTALALAADVTRDPQVRGLMSSAVDHFGRLDLLVNNAGWSTRIPHEHLEELTDEIWDRTVDTNLRGAFYCMRAAAPFLKKQANASILNIASISALTGQGSSIVYAASKAGVITMTKSFARLLAPQVRVNAIAPGLVRTRFANWPASAFEQAQSSTPIRRLPEPEEIAQLALYLVGDGVPITGQSIEIDGGLATLGAMPHVAEESHAR